MLLANFFVAQCLITHARLWAMLRCHPKPQMEKLDGLVAIVHAATGMQIDVSTSQALHASLVQLGHAYQHDPLILQ